MSHSYCHVSRYFYLFLPRAFCEVYAYDNGGLYRLHAKCAGPDYPERVPSTPQYPDVSTFNHVKSALSFERCPWTPSGEHCRRSDYNCDELI